MLSRTVPPYYPNLRKGASFYSPPSRQFVEMETVIFQCKMANKYCGDLRRRRIRTKTAQRNVKVLAREISEFGCFLCHGQPDRIFFSRKLIQDQQKMSHGSLIFDASKISGFASNPYEQRSYVYIYIYIYI